MADGQSREFRPCDVDRCFMRVGESERQNSAAPRVVADTCCLYCWQRLPASSPSQAFQWTARLTTQRRASSQVSPTVAVFSFSCEACRTALRPATWDFVYRSSSPLAAISQAAPRIKKVPRTLTAGTSSPSSSLRPYSTRPRANKPRARPRASKATSGDRAAT